VEHENACTTEEAELEAKIGTHERVEENFNEEGDAEEIETRGVAGDEFADEIQKCGEPTSLDGGDRTDKEEVEIDGEEEDDEFVAIGEEEIEEEGEEGDENGKVKTRNGENVLKAKPSKLVAERTLLYIACEKRGEKGGDARAEKFFIQKMAELLFHLVAKFGEGPSFLDGDPFFWFE